MKTLLLCTALLAGQLQSTDEDVVRLRPHVAAIPISDGGKTVELLYSALVIALPPQPPPSMSTGAAWFVDVKNLGPRKVELSGKNGFTVPLQPNQLVRIRATGATYAIGTH